MSSIYHETFVPYHFGTEWSCDKPTEESGLLPVTPSEVERGQAHEKTIRLYYDAGNFQHLSGVARLISPAFVNHSDEGDTSGVAAMIEALPYIIFVLPDLQIRLQFVPAEPNRIETHDPYSDTDLRPFMDAVPGSIEITWIETLMWRLDEDGKIVERWQETYPGDAAPRTQYRPLESILITRQVPVLGGLIMKRIALFTLLVGLFFGTLALVSADPPYYVSWNSPVLYTCTHSAGEYHLLVALTYLDYDAPSNVVATETDITDNSFGHFVTHQDAESGWMGNLGQRKHTTYTVDSAAYPITLQAILKTYVNGVEDYQSTFTAKCTGNSHGALSASVNNTENPLVFGVWQPPSLNVSHP